MSTTQKQLVTNNAVSYNRLPMVLNGHSGGDKYLPDITFISKTANYETKLINGV
ncbi:MAG: hypothetical protein ACRC7P_04685 [Enterovibrio sp.]